MPDASQLWMFMLAGVLLNLTPGPDVLYIVNQSLRGGVRRGLVAAWGITAGCFVHVAAAALGLGAVLATSTDAFNLIKWMGAAYLLWMGSRLLWRTSQAAGDEVAVSPQAMAALPSESSPEEVPRMRAVFFGAFATNALNPKVALFFLAFVPQFIPAQAADPAWSFVLLGCLFNLNSLLVCMAWALAAAWLSHRAHRLQRGMRHLDRLAGLLFIGFGLKLALTDAPSH
ncbi:LysE family translocator [Limnohabitans sp. Hippo3]|uniref:LysE family translocator n=1 Tax=Limnohabitans sp. Hippo3 TaxID=1597956 RepID=UPI000D35AC25|nr:LysE family translocator [Limnohabitans sp. Hippo3]PUE36896.1 lysine transporter LysE [Limnohabitans sp. Hippo3]